MNKLAESIYKSKYSFNGETWEQTCWRVCSSVSEVEAEFGASEEEVVEFTQELYNIIYNKAFLPGGRILANIGTDIKNLYNCFYFEVGDSRQAIYDTLKNCSEIFAWGGGVGIGLSNLREEGATINTTGGESSGPVSFLELFNLTGDVIQQSSRRAAIIALLDVSHPDIYKFIQCKSKSNKLTEIVLEEFARNLAWENGEEPISKEVLDVLRKTLTDRQLLHFNISVVIPDSFMEAVKEDGDWDLVSPATGEVVKTIKARELLESISRQIWENGDPGILFRDRVDETSLVPYYPGVLGANPCTELNLFSGEACNLGSINLSSVVFNGEIDYGFLEHLVRLGVRFLDNIHELSENNIEEVNQKTKKLRRVGLGVMGFADLLSKMEIPYGSEESKTLAKYLSWFISKFAWLESMVLAEERGVFSLYDEDLVDLSSIRKIFESDYMPSSFDIEAFMESVRKLGVRNVGTVAIAPTGSISLVAEANSGIEPFYSLAYKRYITGGESNLTKESFVVTNPIFNQKLDELSLSEEDKGEIVNYVVENKTVKGCDKVPHYLQEVFKTAHEISPEDHLEVQASWQTFISGAISKTVNVSETYTVKDIECLLEYMWKSGVKSSTIYRDGSRFFQILK